MNWEGILPKQNPNIVPQNTTIDKCFHCKERDVAIGDCTRVLKQAEAEGKVCFIPDNIENKIINIVYKYVNHIDTSKIVKEEILKLLRGEK